MLRAELGLEPWSVLNQGLSFHTGMSIGMVTIVSGALILLLWIPLRQRPGLGTVSNVVILGLVMDATLAVVPDLPHWACASRCWRSPSCSTARRPASTSPPASGRGRATA